MGLVTLRDRPFRIQTLVHAARSAVRARTRQLHVRYLLREREQEQAELARIVIELENSHEELEQFAFIAAHDLQEPNRMVTSYLQLLDHELVGNLSVRGRAYFDYIMTSTVRMGTMVRAVLEYSRIGKDDEEFSDVDTAMAVREAVENLTELIHASGTVVHIGTLPLVRGRKTQIVQLFHHLLSNSITFRSSLPPVVEISGWCEGRTCHFSISDNGIGIPPGEGSKLFGLFQRLHQRHEYPGTGIGLATCKKIVEQLHGRIWFDSISGQGAVFHVTLPTAMAPARREGPRQDSFVTSRAG